MRRFLTTALLAAPLALLAQPASAQYYGGISNLRCSQDYMGNIRCSSLDGSSLRITNDYAGGTRATYLDGWGRQMICRTTSDYAGGFRTSCF